MYPYNPVLVRAVEKLARAGEEAGFTVEEMIELLRTGVSVEMLLHLICTRLDLDNERRLGDFFSAAS